MNRRSITTVGLVTGFFTVLAVIYTYPLVSFLGTRLQNPGDPLFISWTLAWDLHALFTDPLNILHANIYYPYHYTLAYSEMLIGQALFLLPVYPFSDNPVVLHNLSLLTGVVLSGLGAYLLCWCITRSRLLSLIPGVVFAVCPFKLSHLGHLQIQHSQWIPLTLLMLLLYARGVRARGRRWPYLCGGVLCFVLQGLSNGYYFLFLAPVALMVQVFGYFRSPAEHRLTLLRGLAVFWAMSAALMAPFMAPYQLVKSDLGLSRNLDEILHFSAKPVHYLAYNAHNIWFGERTRDFAHIDGSMSPGILLALLVFAPALAALIRSGKLAALFRFDRYIRRAFCKYSRGKALTDFLILVLLVILGLVYFGGGVMLGDGGEPARLLGAALQITDPTRPLLILGALLIVRLYQTGFRLRPREHLGLGEPAVYWVLLVFSVWMSLGPEVEVLGKKTGSLYGFFHRFVPGYQGLRVPARFAVVAMLAMGMLAALNLKTIVGRLRRPFARHALPCVVVLLLCIEYLPYPQRLQFRKHEPSVYTWLKETQPGPIIEFPIREAPHDFFNDVKYVFYSTVHWQKLLNGYSGYSPPAYDVILHHLRNFPDETSKAVLGYLGIKTVIAHSGDEALMEVWAKDLDLVVRFDNDYVFQLRESIAPELPTSDPGEVIPKAAWRAVAADPPGNRPLNVLNDGSIEKRWHSQDDQEKGMWVELALDAPRTVSGVRLHMGDFPSDFPRGVALSGRGRDGRWEPLPEHAEPLRYIDAVLKKPRAAVFEIRFRPVELEGLKLELSESAPGFLFTLCEIDLLR